MDLSKKVGVNYDYIIGLKRSGEGISIIKYPIERHDFEIDRALKCLENDDDDASDVYDALYTCLYGCSTTYNYCLAHEYTHSDIKDITPIKFDTYAYRKSLHKAIAEEVESKLRWIPRKIRDNEATIAKVKDEVKKKLYKKHKEELIEKALPYVYAVDYNNTIEGKNIKGECIIFSHERRGDGRGSGHRGHHDEYKINDDISVRVETNFCYGRSTYFNVVVTYKGIELLPYSIWVRYYYAGYAHLLGCTRSYLRVRSSWDVCMSWLEGFINSAISNPESFIHNEVITEVQGLMDGLEEIFSLDDNTFKNRLNVKERPGDERYIGISGVRYANESDEEEYQIAPKEIPMIYRMEKISGALNFLDSLRRIREIYSEVSDAINRIIEMNQTLLPEVEAAIPPVENEIKDLNAELSRLQRRMKYNEEALDKYQRKLDTKLAKISSLIEREEFRENFERDVPIYIELREIVDNLSSNIYTLEYKLSKREAVIKKLNLYKSLILKYTKSGNY